MGARPFRRASLLARAVAITAAVACLTVPAPDAVAAPTLTDRAGLAAELADATARHDAAVAALASVDDAVAAALADLDVAVADQLAADTAAAAAATRAAQAQADAQAAADALDRANVAVLGARSGHADADRADRAAAADMADTARGVRVAMSGLSATMTTIRVVAGRTSLTDAVTSAVYLDHLLAYDTARARSAATDVTVAAGVQDASETAAQARRRLTEEAGRAAAAAAAADVAARRAAQQAADAAATVTATLTALQQLQATARHDLSALAEEVEQATARLAEAATMAYDPGSVTATQRWVAALPAAGRPWADEIVVAAEGAGIDPRLLAALVWTESAFNPSATSHAGAHGLTQLMPQTAAGLGVDRTDPVANLAGGARYLAQMAARYDQQAELALAAYNAGPGRVDAAGRAVPQIAETQAYVVRVLARYDLLRSAS